MVPGLTSTNATLTAENSRLNDRMAKLVQDLTEENKHLLDENQRLNQTVQKVHLSSIHLLTCKPLMQQSLTRQKGPAISAASQDPGYSSCGYELGMNEFPSLVWCCRS